MVTVTLLAPTLSPPSINDFTYYMFMSSQPTKIANANFTTVPSPANITYSLVYASNQSTVNSAIFSLDSNNDLYVFTIDTSLIGQSVDI